MKMHRFGELISQKVTVSDRGQFEITEKMLLDLAPEMWETVEDAIEQVIIDNPEFEFMISHDVVTGNQIIRWRRRNDAALARERDVLPE